MLIASTRVNMAVFGVFLTLEITEIVLAFGFWSGNGAGQGLVAIGGWLGIITAAVAWYASGAGVINSLLPRPRAWVGEPLWKAAGVSTADRSASAALPRR